MATVVVIGAGSAGLAAAAELGRRGIETTVLERGRDVGTSWRARHDELRLNTVRWLSDLRGLPLPREAGRWVARDDYIAYLERFAAKHELDIRFSTSVERIENVDGEWQLTTASGSERTRYVVVATGHDQVPSLPAWPGRDTSTIPVRHAATHRSAHDLTGQRVLLAGSGNSAVELAGHLVDARVASLWMSVRRSPNIMPREVLGLPLHPFTLGLGILPERVRDALARRIARWTLGDLTAYGLPTPPDGPFRRMRTTGVTVAVDQGFVAHLRAGHIEVVPEIERFDENDVVLTDGRRITPDLVLAATGFRPGTTQLFAESELGATSPVARRRASERGVWLVGFTPAIAGNLRQHPGEARRVARAIARDLRRAPQSGGAAPTPSRTRGTFRASTGSDQT